ncbi:MAG: PSD1 and planctomycete cytochrome C domain-containing protein [Planctomycetota bacterium]|nr:PSD1 and planctomycete cytochrome C domain-containing protein [Planctomycetota bacterium]
MSTSVICFVASTISTQECFADQAGDTFFEQKIRPVLIEHCYRCHSAKAEKLKGNLHLDSKAGWQTGGDSGEPAIIPGKPEESPLLKSVQHLEAGLEMPPDAPRLPDAVIADLVTWVKMGAPDPRADVKIDAKRGDKSWWSLQPIAKDFHHESIDDFIGEKLNEQALERNPPADARTLIRRMTYDVTGLPPTMEEVDAFIAACEANQTVATENLVDRLLASPRYGERWGRHWLDVIRFGESNGFERNVIVDNLWPFRDYVIQSINADKPFNQFIIEHLAGDVIGKEDPTVAIGSAFLVAGPYDDVGNQDAVAQKNIRAATLDDMITATSGAFLGLTINCARCHNHKFDPIPTEDYYRIRNAFEGVRHGVRTIASKADRQAFELAMQPLAKEKAKLISMREKLDNAIEDRAKVEFEKLNFPRPKIDVHGTIEDFTATETRFIRFVIHSVTTDGKKTKPGEVRSGRLSEFEVWNTKNANVALASYGSKADGSRSTTAEDFPDAYGPQYCIDGKQGEQWFIGTPAVLTITLPQPEMVHRIHFSNSKGREMDESKVRGATPCEYDVEVSLDGQQWTKVASSGGREPWTAAHGIQRARRYVITDDEERQLQRFDQDINDLQSQILRIPKLQQVWAGNFTQPNEPTYVQLGGDPMKPTELVLPSSLNVLNQVAQSYELPVDAPESQRRLELAKWIASDSNPLTARVLANRVWQYHFGTGIVDTPSDFGFLGSQPTHPALLDYLANQLISYKWRLKPLHREILLSKTYLQNSSFRESAATLDKDARLLWRFPPRRLSAEELRDTILMAAGKLKLEPAGGPGFRLYRFTQNNVCTYFPLDVHGPETYRRSVYHQNARASVVDVLSEFDLPDNAFAAPKRSNTTTPMQALTMLNHSFTIDMANALSDRCRNLPNPESAIAAAYRTVYQRPPTEVEIALASDFVAINGLEHFCRVLLNTNELIYID